MLWDFISSRDMPLDQKLSMSWIIAEIKNLHIREHSEENAAVPEQAPAGSSQPTVPPATTPSPAQERLIGLKVSRTEIPKSQHV